MPVIDVDRRMVELWAERGIPNDPTTLAAAGRIIRNVLAEVDEWKHIVDAASTDVCGCFDRDHDGEVAA